VVPLLLVEPSTRVLKSLLAGSGGMCVWWGTRVEAASALSRRAREGVLSQTELNGCIDRLDRLSERWIEVEPGERVRDFAVSAVGRHDLRAADAFQLAAALVAADGEPGSVELVSLDRRLREAAAREGLRLRPETIEEART
jgi:predicted nucleic acid-binding protein